MNKNIFKRFLIYSTLLSILIYIIVFYAGYRGWKGVANISPLVNYSFLIVYMYYKFRYKISFKIFRKAYLIPHYWILILGIPILVFIFPVLITFGFPVLGYIFLRPLQYWPLTILNLLTVEGIIVSMIFWFGIIYEYLIKRYDHIISAFIVGAGMFLLNFPSMYLNAISLPNNLKEIFLAIMFLLFVFFALWLAWIYLITNRSVLILIVAYTWASLLSLVAFDEVTFIANTLNRLLWFLLIFYIYILKALKRIKLVQK